MANLFLDANYFIDFTERQKLDLKEKLIGNKLYVSVLSVHILAYAYKYNVPNKKLKEYLKKIFLVPFNKNLFMLSLDGPTKDLEDNIQLHSAAKTEADFFLTNDKKLLKMKFFGKMRIVTTI